MDRNDYQNKYMSMFIQSFKFYLINLYILIVINRNKVNHFLRKLVSIPQFHKIGL